MSKPKRPAWLAATITSALLVALTAGAGTASAAPCEAGDHSFEGAGASLQAVAQGIWIPEWQASAECTGSDPISGYESLGSGGGLDKWGARGTTVWDSDVGYVATDDPPTAGNIANIKAAAHGDTEVLVIPVAQAALGIGVNLPANCTLTEISNEDLQQVFEGQGLTWTDIGGVGAGCGVEIDRVVRQDASGTTFAFKHYLEQIVHHTDGTEAHSVDSPGGVTHAARTWTELENVNVTQEGLSLNQTWPNPTQHLIRPAGAGNDDVVDTVEATDSTIAYSNLADWNTFGPGVPILEVDNNIEGEPNHVGPTAGETVNCDGADYDIDSSHHEPDADWTGVEGSDPNVGGNSYPICTLTYVLALTNYEAGHEEWEGEEGHEIADNVAAYLDWVTRSIAEDNTAGQHEIHDQGYGTLPGEIRDAAIELIPQIGEGP